MKYWRGDRVVEGTGLENRRSESYRGFESHPLRHNGRLAQLEEHLVYTEGVGGSSPSSPTTQEGIMWTWN